MQNNMLTSEVLSKMQAVAYCENAVDFKII